MGIVLASNFDVNAALPLDSRESVANTTARDAIVSGRRWQGMQVYVVADQKVYYLKSGITNSDWAELGSSGAPTFTGITYLQGGVRAGIQTLTDSGALATLAPFAFIGRTDVVLDSIAGIDVPTGAKLQILFNDSNKIIPIINESGSATSAAARIRTPDGQTFYLGINQAVWLMYDIGYNRWYIVGSSAGDGSIAFGTFAVPRDIVAANGIIESAGHMSSTAKNQTIYVKSSTSNLSYVSSNPRIQLSVVDGAIIELVGGTNTAPVWLDDGNGLDLNGRWIGTTGNTLRLRMDLANSTWREVTRKL